MVNRPKIKGTAFETLILGAWQQVNQWARRNALNGAKDTGDLYLPGEERYIVECKNVKAMALSQWIEEARIEAENAGVPCGIVVHKRRGKGDALDQFVTLTVRDFLYLVHG